MRGKSHISLGYYLLSHYLPDLPKYKRLAFLLGCIEPDRNPTTYLKGSIRFQWLRGHNYHNAKKFMHRISARLEQKDTWNLFDYYTLGKLIHYTADAFTFAHNASFPDNLSGHREYEVKLQEYFLRYLQEEPQIDICFENSIAAVISCYHQEYTSMNTDVGRDSRFILHACCCVLAVLLTPRIL